MTLIEGLVILAALVMLVLLGQGLWLVWRSRPRKAQIHSAPSGYASTGSNFDLDQRIEPSTDLMDADHSGPKEPTLLQTHEAVSQSSLSLRPRIDPMIDAIAVIKLDRPIPGDVITAHLPPTRRVCNKYLLLEGQNLESSVWELLQNQESYTQLHLGLQMVNRMGVLNEIEYSEFVQKSQKLAEELCGTLELEDMTIVVARARELDQFAQTHDAQLVVNLLAQKSSWSIGYIQQVATRHGLTAGPLPGLFLALPKYEDGPPVVSLTFDAQVAMSDIASSAGLRQISLAFDVAQHSPEHAPFGFWQGLANDLAAELDAVILDDSGQIVGASEFAAIEHDLQGLYQRLAHFELPAGSTAARRLFS